MFLRIAQFCGLVGVGLFLVYGGMWLRDLARTEEGYGIPAPSEGGDSLTSAPYGTQPPQYTSQTQIAEEDISREPVLVVPPLPTLPFVTQISSTSIQKTTPPPEPLIARTIIHEDTLAPLNSEHIRERTNLERAKSGLPPLSFAPLLESMALKKAQDMRDKQYFAHESPSGIDVSGLADQEGYEYLTVGENLALGHFTSSGHVVDGWMNSPGHRANILHTQFTEIGVAAIQGMYEGEKVWFAVQEFGRPQSDCPRPDALLEKKITIYSTQLDTLEGTLAIQKQELSGSAMSREEYEAKARDYNSVVALYNNVVALMKSAVEEYNVSARAFNSCIDDGAMLAQ